MSSNSKFLAIFLAFLVLAAILVMCLRPRPVEIPPTLAISETPSLTPEIPTDTPAPTLVVAEAVLTLPAQATAVTSTPPDTVTAVAPATPTTTPTARLAMPTPTLSPPPQATERPSKHVVEAGDCLACLSWDWYGTETRWQHIWEANGKFPKPHIIHPGQELIIP